MPFTARRTVPDTQKLEAFALWYAAPLCPELSRAQLPAMKADDVLVRTEVSHISRGTERLIYEGRLPESEWQRMRGPNQEGEFPFPVKYGYQAVGIVEAGPESLKGKRVFCLHPHQDRFVVPAGAVVVIPEAVPAERAVLAASLETALNAVWDSGAGPGEHILVIGAGVLGLAVASIVSRLPGAVVTVADVVSSRRGVVEALACRFVHPDDIAPEQDVVFHTSANPAGLQRALEVAALEATIVEISWYGDKPVPLTLGGAFHSRRLKLVSSQVGTVAASRRGRFDHRRRLEAAVRLLEDERLDAIAFALDRIRFGDLPGAMPRLFNDAGSLGGLVIYPS